MARRTREFLRVLLPLVVAVVALCVAPLELPVGMDLSQILFSARSVLGGGDIYGIGTSRVSTDPRTFGFVGELPYPGPPWSFPPLVTLGLFSPEKAAAVWFVVSVLALCASIALVSPGLTLLQRTIVVIAALLSAPAQGHLIVGQTTLLALLGAALVATDLSLSSVGVGIGIWLLSFRPHLGLPIAVLCLLFLARRDQSSFLSSSAWSVGLIASSFLVAVALDPTCLSGYRDHIATLNSLPSNKVCDTCSSIPVLLTDRAPNALNSVWEHRFILWASGSIAFGALLLWSARSLPLVLAGSVCVSLLWAPYNRNYDYVMLVVPFMIVGRKAWSLRGPAPRNAQLALGLVATGVAIGGILPYMASRALQGDTMWLSSVCGYVATLLVSKGNAESKTVV